jgi:hypothetical protein
MVAAGTPILLAQLSLAAAVSRRSDAVPEERRTDELAPPDRNEAETRHVRDPAPAAKPDDLAALWSAGMRQTAGTKMDPGTKSVDGTKPKVGPGDRALAIQDRRGGLAVE